MNCNSLIIGTSIFCPLGFSSVLYNRKAHIVLFFPRAYSPLSNLFCIKWKMVSIIVDFEAALLKLQGSSVALKYTVGTRALLSEMYSSYLLKYYSSWLQTHLFISNKSKLFSYFFSFVKRTDGQ